MALKTRVVSGVLGGRDVGECHQELEKNGREKMEGLGASQGWRPPLLLQERDLLGSKDSASCARPREGSRVEGPRCSGRLTTAWAPQGQQGAVLQVQIEVGATSEQTRC